MIRVDATGFDDTHPDDRPALYVSGGNGNTDVPEVHITFVDPCFDPDTCDDRDGAVNLVGWFDARQLLLAIKTACAPKTPEYSFLPDEIEGISQLIRESEERP
ncbi:hypothetical protein [Microbacterium sp. No. 7]|uniref:hypothetical protein n=1 Tax=Microbacterium sp. No. 7 TaxID=1714373 RepID=UPI0006D25264|nr:hypothetical protein [Microbacterium sp. No. 7]ALJ19508.1 hypothetical protein AOA12_06140 [Microbacterium sp. No. 7]